ncbi:hypothetical protein ACFPAG_07835 [Vogesella sp. GCM10023246]|uniref:Uncharacterized protein n=1 Tax=Vogesella oryzagri TaxID=3160864 RepID=A0ABV1M2S1_9NEIS
MYTQYQIDIVDARKHINSNVYQIDTAALNARMKSIDEIRRENMRKLVTENCKGILKEFAAAAGIQPGQASHLNTGFRNIGDNIARRIENAFDLEKGWMDREHSASHPTVATNSTPAATEANDTTEIPEELAPLLIAARQAYLRGSLQPKTIDNLVQLINSLAIEPPSTEQTLKGTRTAKASIGALRRRNKPS